jgi:hypothetical protein
MISSVFGEYLSDVSALKSLISHKEASHLADLAEKFSLFATSSDLDLGKKNAVTLFIR